MSFTVMKGILESRINHLHFKRHTINVGGFTKGSPRGKRKNDERLLISPHFKAHYFNPVKISEHATAISKPIYTQQETIEAKSGTIGASNTLKFNLTETFAGRIIDKLYVKTGYTSWGGDADGAFRGEFLQGASCIQRVRYYQTSNSILEYERDEWELALSLLKEDARDSILRCASSSDPGTTANSHTTPMINFWNFLEYHPARSLLVDRLSKNDIWIDLTLVSAAAKIGTNSNGTVAFPGTLELHVIYHELLSSDHEEAIKHSESDHLVNYIEMIKQDFTGVAAATTFNVDLSGFQANSKLIGLFVRNEDDYGNDIGTSSYHALENTVTSISLRNGGREIFGKDNIRELDSLMASVCETNFPRNVIFMPFSLQDPLETLNMHLGSLNHSHLEDIRLSITINVGDTDSHAFYAISFGEAYLSYDEKGKVKIHM